MDFMSEAQQFTAQILLLNKYICSKSLLLRMQVNLGLREKSKMYWPHKKIRQPVPNLIPFYSSEYSAKSLQLKCCCKSEAQKRLSFVCNDNKAFRAKNKKRQTVDEVHDSRNVQFKARAEKNNFFEKHKRHSKTLRGKMLIQDENALQISRRTKHLC